MRHHRGDGQGPHEVDPAEDPGSEPHAGGCLGAGEWPSRRGGATVGACNFIRVASAYTKSIAQVCFARVAGCRMFCKQTSDAFPKNYSLRTVILPTSNPRS
jgi:hypothetical protein